MIIFGLYTRNIFSIKLHLIKIHFSLFIMYIVIYIVIAANNIDKLFTVSTGKPISCCRSDGNTLSPRYVHPDCSVIMVPDRDPIYGQHYVRCMNYVRSLPVLKAECTFGPAEQVYLTFFVINLVIFINLI